VNRVLITGGHGFVGRQVLSLLSESDVDLHAVSSTHSPTGEQRIHWWRTDLHEHEQVTRLLAEVRPTHLLHLAWIATPGAYWTSNENYRWVASSLHLLEEFRRSGGRRAVVAGTCAEYDWRYGFCSEDVTPVNPSTVYGSCKASLGSLVRTMSGTEQFSAAWGRIFLLYGPHEDSRRFVASVISSLLSGRTADCSHGEQVRDLLHVRDVASGFVRLLDSDFVGPVNICSGMPVALRDVALAVGRKVGCPERVRLGAIAASPGEVPLLVGDNRRLRELGWTPQFSLDTGLDDTIDWWRRHGQAS
jgi:nucleoside-diphosphate-sugar epimerase